MDDPDFPYYAALPLLVFGPLFVWLLYTFGLREMVKMPAAIRALRRVEADEAVRRAEMHWRKRGPGRPGKGARVLASPLAWIGQGLFYGAFAVAVGGLSDWPAYRPMAAEEALIKLSISLPGRHMVACRRRTAEELAALAPNMRAPKVCSRRRWPVTFALVLDGVLIHRQTVAPRGLAGDGPSSVYRTFRVAAGRHRLRLGIRETGAAQGFDHARQSDVDLAPGRVLAVGFDRETGVIRFR